AETNFRLLDSPRGGPFRIEAEPLTGRTHQIRVHAAAEGFPIIGDKLYGGSAGPRLCLHAAELKLRHPVTNQEITFSAPIDFNADARLALREGIIDAAETDAFRVVHGVADGHPGWYVDRLGEFLLSQAEQELGESRRRELGRLMAHFGTRGAYHKI